MDSVSAIADEVRSLVGAAVTSAGCELWDLSLAGATGRRLLRVYIEAPGGVDIERCTRVSRVLRPLLDEPALGLSDVDLEVSSPGAERRLRGMADYLRFIGQRVNMRFRRADAESVVEGALLRVTDDSVFISARDQVVEVPIADLLEARLAVEFGGDDRPHRPHPPGSRR